MFQHAIVRKPCRAMVDGITGSPELGQPDYRLACRQHEAYIAALGQCGVEVMVLEANEDFPDSCFVEDVAVLTAKCAVITNPGAASRKGEVKPIRSVLERFYAADAIREIKIPGTLEGGDVMMVEDHFYIGVSDRTNEEGAAQLKAILELYGYTASILDVVELLHLKTGMTYIGDGNLVISKRFTVLREMERFTQILVPDEEEYCANCININGTIVVPEGYPQTLRVIREKGYPTVTVPMSEFRKIDGGLTCLSLRF